MSNSSLTRDQVLQLRGQMVVIVAAAERIFKAASGVEQFAEYIDPEKVGGVFDMLREETASLHLLAEEYSHDWSVPEEESVD